MGLFGFGRDAEPEREMPSALQSARADYGALRKSLPDGALVLAAAGENKAFPKGQYYFACTDREFLFLEKVAENETSADRYRACRIKRFAREETEASKPRAETGPTAQDGLLRRYAVQPVTLVFANGRFGEARFTAANNKTTERFLQDNLPGCALLPLFDWFDRPEKAYEASCKKGGGLLPDGTALEIWREGENLVLLRRRVDYYSQANEFWYGTLPVADILYFQEKGQIDYETKVSGGGVSIDRSGAMWGGMFSMNANAGMLESAVVSEPIRTERIEHDNRYVALAVRQAGAKAEIQFGYGALAAFQQMIPEKSFEERMPYREPTAAEQIEILANVCERGYLTREEFEEAKKKLLAKL
ncbi:SHOCT domain-containing protein [Intestinibacillus massiliensis]|nr:SHOCT domain-containing protein [Intestinibacillus massiliensis]